MNKWLNAQNVFLISSQFNINKSWTNRKWQYKPATAWVFFGTKEISGWIVALCWKSCDRGNMNIYYVRWYEWAKMEKV